MYCSGRYISCAARALWVVIGELATPDAAERERVRASLRRRARATAEEMGSGIVQSTRPQTLAYGLTDSPAGAGGLDRGEVQGVDRVRGAARGGRRPRPAADRAGWAVALQPSTVPTGVAVLPHDTSVPVRYLAERTDAIVHWSGFDRGGHFPAMEVPDLLVRDLRAFFRIAGGRSR